MIRLIHLLSCSAVILLIVKQHKWRIEEKRNQVFYDALYELSEKQKLEIS